MEAKATKTLTPQEKLDWLRLARTPQVGPITFRQLLVRTGSATAALELMPEFARRGGRACGLSPAPLKQIEAELRGVEKYQAKLICLCEPDYLDLLRQIEDAPPVITIVGNASLLHKDQFGIVGARNASLNGRKMAETLAHDLGEKGYVITSGLARGIDTSAHISALGTGTIAVVAGGVDVIYPEENRKLYGLICERGCVIAEQPFGLQPQANLFARRNRLISGLSLGVVVVEAAKKSGSLITARQALEQGRDVFAVPGSPLDPRAGGTNSLLRQGAFLTESAEDILDEIARPKHLFAEPPADPFEAQPLSTSPDNLEDGRGKILENLSPSPISVDELVRQCQLSLPLVLTVLLELELAGRLDRQPGHQVALIGNNTT